MPRRKSDYREKNAPHVWRRTLRPISPSAASRRGSTRRCTGLGLAVAKGIVRGGIAVESPSRTGAAPECRSVCRCKERGLSESTRVLVVDDEPAIHRFLTPALLANN